MNEVQQELWSFLEMGFQISMLLSDKGYVII